MHAEKGRSITCIHITVEYNKKNSAEDVSNERAVDAFTSGLRRSDLIEELGRAKPKTVSELMEIVNRFADGEGAYHARPNMTDQAGNATKGVDLATRTTAPGVTKSPRDTREETKEAMIMRSIIEKTTTDERGRSILTHRQRTSVTDLATSTMHI
jgi:hypothetical protein